MSSKYDRLGNGEEDLQKEVTPNPGEKMRVRMAAESYNTLNNNDGSSGHDLADTEGEKKTGGKSQTSSSRLERQLLILLFVAVLIVVGLCIALIFVSFQNAHNQVCMSPDCVQTAGTMLSRMNLTSDPCVNFFEYACSAYEHGPTVPPDQSRWGIFQELSAVNLAIVKRALDEPTDVYHGAVSTAVQKAKQTYHTCMNSTATEEQGIPQMLTVIEQLDYWPVLSGDKWNQDTWTLDSALVKAHLLATNQLFTMGVGQDDKNSSRLGISFDQGGTTIRDREVYVNATLAAKIKPAFVKLFTDVVVLLGAADAAATRAAAEDVWMLEAAIAEAQDKPEDRTNPGLMYHLMTVDQLQESMGNPINLATYLKGLFGHAIPVTQPVIVYAPGFMKKVAALVKAADKQTLANYLVWQTVESFIPYLPIQFKLALSNLQHVLTGSEGTGSAWQACVRSTDAVVPLATGALFVQVQFGQEQKAEVESVLELIRDTLTAQLPRTHWMDMATLKRALDKAQAIVQKIGYPDLILDPKKLDNYYEELVVTTDSAFLNSVHARKFLVNRELTRLGRPPEVDRWDMSPAEVNAYYNPAHNEIVFPAGILQKPFFHLSFPKSLVFGGIGMVMGHELTHAFDNMGRQYDKYGNLNDWWTNKSSKAFEEKTQCLVKQYSKDIVQGQHLNGALTLGENIADNGGLKVAYYAYHSWLKGHGYTEPTLPGLNMTGDQLFFLSFAQVWCAYFTPEEALLRLRTDVHSYPKYRVLETLHNMQAFADAYNCPAGSAMNPEHTCTVW